MESLPLTRAGSGYVVLLLPFLWGGTMGVSPAHAQSTPVQPDSAKTGQTEALRPGDRIALRVWREPDLSDTVIVNEDGISVFPRLGPIPVVKFSRDSLKNLLLSSYGEYLRNPSIEITFLRRVSVFGAVRNPGVVNVDPTVTVTEVLALAGGPTPDGKVNEVELWRDTERIKINLSPGTRLAETPIRSGDRLHVPQRSWLSRNYGFVIGTLATAAGLIVAFTRY